MARNLIEEQIPDSWTYDLLDSLTERVSGHTPSKSYPEYWNGGIKWISLADTFRLDNGYVYETDKEISQEGINNSSAQLHPAETVVLSRDAGIGKSGVMAEPMAVSQHFIAWKCDNEKKMNSWFLYNWLQLHKSEFERQAVGSTIKTIGLPFFKKLKIAAPPYKEQLKIAQILSTWDKAISTTERLINNSKHQKKALMQQLLTGKKRLLDDSDKPFSDEWQEVPLDSVVQYSKGYTYKSNDYSEEPTEFGFLTLKSFLRGGGYSSKGIKYLKTAVDDRFSVDEGDLIFAITDLTRNAEVVGAPVLVPKLEFKSSYISMDIVKLEVDKNIDKTFLFYLMKIRENRNFMRARASGSTVLHLDVKGSKKLKLKLPKNKVEQKKIAAVLKNADQEIELLLQQLADLKQEKKALMQQLLTGKRRVKVDSSETA